MQFQVHVSTGTKRGRNPNRFEGIQALAFDDRQPVASGLASFGFASLILQGCLIVRRRINNFSQPNRIDICKKFGLTIVGQFGSVCTCGYKLLVLQDRTCSSLEDNIRTRASARGNESISLNRVDANLRAAPALPGISKIRSSPSGSF